MSPRARQGLKVAGGVAAVAVLVLAAIDAFSPAPSGPDGSSYATAPQGVSAYAELLSRSGHPVVRLRGAPSSARLDPPTTVVMLEPALLSSADVRALRQFVVAGGTLVAGGQNPEAWLSRLLPDPPAWSNAGESSVTPLLPTPATASVSEVQTAGAGSWSEPNATLPLLGSPDASLLNAATLGAGRVELLADTSPLQNQWLAAADNAAFGVSLAGPPGRTVAFEEGVHGYGVGTGLAALPVRWKWVLAGLVLAALAGVAARFRRLAPPDPEGPPALPPRREHVEAIAIALARTGRPAEATANVRERARDLVRRRSGLGADEDAATLRQAASRLGLDEGEVQALFSAEPGRSDAELLAAGRALAELSGPRA
jgi:hypothetical protein